MEGGFALDTVQETRFVTEQADAGLAIPYRIVAFVNLAAETAEVRIKEHLALSEKVVGVRMITNYVEGRGDLIYPQVRSAARRTAAPARSLPPPRSRPARGHRVLSRSAAFSLGRHRALAPPPPPLPAGAVQLPA